MNTIIAALKKDFADIDAKYEERQVEWAMKRRASLKEKIAELQPKRRSMGEQAYYDEIFNEAGGKGWFNLFWGRGSSDVEELVRKKCKETVKARNSSIEKKLTKAEITEVVGNPEISQTGDGFHGVFYVETNKGHRIIEIETILAGGYNIQCLHCRTLVKVKK